MLDSFSEGKAPLSFAWEQREFVETCRFEGRFLKFVRRMRHRRDAINHAAKHAQTAYFSAHLSPPGGGLRDPRSLSLGDLASLSLAALVARVQSARGLVEG